MGEEYGQLSKSLAGDKPPLSARRAFLQADFFAYMLDYQATTARMSRAITEGELAADKALRDGQETQLIQDYQERLQKGARRLKLARALSDEELHEIQRDLDNMPASVRAHLTRPAKTAAEDIRAPQILPPAPALR